MSQHDEEIERIEALISELKEGLAFADGQTYYKDKATISALQKEVTLLKQANPGY